jgi:hypothetical protein
MQRLGRAQELAHDIDGVLRLPQVAINLRRPAYRRFGAHGRPFGADDPPCLRRSRLVGFATVFTITNLQPRSYLSDA